MEVGKTARILNRTLKHDEINFSLPSLLVKIGGQENQLISFPSITFSPFSLPPFLSFFLLLLSFLFFSGFCLDFFLFFSSRSPLVVLFLLPFIFPLLHRFILILRLFSRYPYYTLALLLKYFRLNDKDLFDIFHRYFWCIEHC